jgi:cyclopropane-fatty-acyl-phospholipid synthase
MTAAQLRKIDGVLDHAGVRAGSRVLEIGTGWGALAIRAAQRGATVTSITISVEQQQMARERSAAAGVADRVTVELLDYRSATGSYDAVVSVEMIEAVGEEFWPTYFATLARVLAPGGRIGLQAITMPHDRLLVTRDSNNWIQKYIFPGGLIPSVRAVEEQAARAGLTITTRRSLGMHYARTLAEWRTRFLAAGDRVAELGFDPTFQRLWEYYLAYSEAGFRSRYLDVWQFGLRSAG